MSDLTAIGKFKGKLSHIRRTSDKKALADKILSLPSDKNYKKCIDPFLSALRDNGHAHVADVFTTRSNEGLLTDSEYELLSDKQRILCDYIDPDCGIVSSLASNGVFTTSDETRISAHKTANQKVEQIIKILLCKSKSSYQRFFDSLQENDQAHVTYILTGCGNPPISEADLKLIRNKRQYVCQTMDSIYSPLLSALLRLGVFTEYDRQRVEAKANVNPERSEQILDILARKSKRHFDNFIRALNETDQKHVADLLRNDLSVTGTVNVIFSQVPSSEQEQQSVEEKLKTSLERDLENEESEFSKELDAIGIHDTDVWSGSIVIRFKFLSRETLDAMQSGKLDVVFTERYCTLLADDGVVSIHIDIPEAELERCRQLIDNREAVIKPDHQKALKLAARIVDKVTVDEPLLKELVSSNHYRNVILQQSSEDKAKVLLEIMDRRPDHEFNHFVNVLRTQHDIAADSSVGKNSCSFIEVAYKMQVINNKLVSHEFSVLNVFLWH